MIFNQTVGNNNNKHNNTMKSGVIVLKCSLNHVMCYGRKEIMLTYKFDCNSNNAPAYSCNRPGDNSGEYYRVSAVAPLIKLLERTLAAHEQSCVDWDAMRGIERFLAAHNPAVELDRANPCGPTCQRHITHPCENCGRQWG